MQRSSSLLVGFVISATALLGCSSNDNPLLVDVAAQFSQSYCIKLEQCLGPFHFEQAYPGGLEECSTRSFRIHGTDERSICSQEDWDICTEDLKETTCVESDDGSTRPKIPDSCQGC